MYEYQQKPTVLYDEATERAFIGCLLKTMEFFPGLTADSFYFEKWQSAFSILESAHSEGQRPSLELFAADVDLYLAVTDAETVAPVGSRNAEKYAERIKELSRLRKLQGAGLKAVESVQGGETSDEVFKAAMAELEAIENAETDNAPRLLSDGLYGVVNKIFDWEQERAQFHFPDLDKALGGGVPFGSVVTVVARSGVGKSQFLIDAVARQLRHMESTGERNPIVVYTLEMSYDQFMLRLFSNMIEHNCMGLTEDELVESGVGDWVISLAGKLHNLDLPIYIQDDPYATVEDVERFCRRTEALHGCKVGLLGVDYYQILSSEKDIRDRRSELVYISRSLKANTAKHCDFSLVLAQVPGEVDARADRRPQAGDIFESKTLQNDSDAILAMYRESKYEAHCDEPDLTELILRKYRHGREGITVRVEGKWDVSRMYPVQIERQEIEIEDY